MIDSSIHGARQIGPKRKQGKVHGEVIKDTLIEVDGVTYPINSAKKGKSGCHRGWLIRLIRHARAMEEIYGRILVVRFDLHQPDYTEKNDRVSAFIKAMSKQIQRKYGHEMGYFWAREQEKAKSQHYHSALILDGDRVSHGKTIVDLVEVVWAKMGGTIGKCREPYMVIGRGGASLADATYWLSYATKIRGKGYRADYAQDFSTGHATIKAKPKRKAKIVKFIPMNQGTINLRMAPRTRSGLSTEQLDLLCLRPVIAAAWGVVGGVKRTAVKFNMSPSGIAKIVKAYRPGELENSHRLTVARQAATRAKGLELIRQGMGQVEAARAVGASDSAGHHWVKADPELVEAKRVASADWVARRAKAVEMFEAGAKGKAISEATGLSSAMVCKIRRELGKPKQSAGATVEQVVELVRLVGGGMSVRGAAKVVGVTYSMARRRLAVQDGAGGISAA